MVLAALRQRDALVAGAGGCDQSRHDARCTTQPRSAPPCRLHPSPQHVDALMPATHQPCLRHGGGGGGTGGQQRVSPRLCASPPHPQPLASPSPCPPCAHRERRSSALKLPKKKARRRHTDVRHRPLSLGARWEGPSGEQLPLPPGPQCRVLHPEVRPRRRQRGGDRTGREEEVAGVSLLGTDVGTGAESDV